MRYIVHATIPQRITSPANMRRTDGQSEVGFAARVPAQQKKALEAILTATSGKTWFIRTALKQFNEACRQDPQLVLKVTEAVLAMRGEEPPRGLVDFLVRVPVQDYNEFNEMFPDKGATTWFIRGAIECYLKQSENRATPDDYVLEAVRGMLGLAESTY